MKKIKTVAFIVVLAVVAMAFVACNPIDVGGYETFTNVYENHTSTTEFTSYEVAIESLPAGWSLYSPTTTSTEFKNSNSGYVSELDGFVVKKTLGSYTYLRIVKCGTSELMFQENLAITALRVANGHIVLKSANGVIFVTDLNGKVVIPQGIITGAEKATIDSTVRVLTNELIVTNPNYDKNATDNKSYTCVYRASTGRLACRVKNAGADLACLQGFDNDYIVSTGTKEDNVEVSRIFRIPASGADVINIAGTEYGSYYSNGESDYYNEITYMGDGKFFIHEDWTVDKEEDYTYHYNDEYVKVVRFIYYANLDSRVAYNSNYYFLNLANQYYGSERNGIANKNFLRDGFYYASYCIYVDSNKEGYYDQFILDDGFNIVYSLSGNFGAPKDTITEVDTISYYDLALLFVDGIGIVPLPSHNLRVVDDKGNTLFTIDKAITSAAYNNGMIIATSLNAKGQTVYAVYDITGKEIVPFSKGFTEINPFLGYYTLAKLDGKTVLLSKDGNVVEKMSDNETVPFGDIAQTASKSDIYKLGSYMFAETRTSTTTGNETKYYGIKNLSTDVNSNVLIPANMVSGSLMYAPASNPNQVYVFAKYEGSDSFVVYKLV